MAKIHISFKDFSELIVKEIQDEPFFDKNILIPKIRAIARATELMLSAANYKNIDTPSEHQKRLRMIEEKDFDIQFWKGKLQGVVPSIEMEELYKEIDLERIKAGF